MKHCAFCGITDEIIKETGSAYSIYTRTIAGKATDLCEHCGKVLHEIIERIKTFIC